MEKKTLKIKQKSGNDISDVFCRANRLQATFLAFLPKMSILLNKVLKVRNNEASSLFFVCLQICAVRGAPDGGV